MSTENTCRYATISFGKLAENVETHGGCRTALLFEFIRLIIIQVIPFALEIHLFVAIAISPDVSERSSRMKLYHFMREIEPNIGSHNLKRKAFRSSQIFTRRRTANAQNRKCSAVLSDYHRVRNIPFRHGRRLDPLFTSPSPLPFFREHRFIRRRRHGNVSGAGVPHPRVVTPSAMRTRCRNARQP